MTLHASRFTSHASRFALPAILLLAALLRLGWPGLTEFKADEARLYALALDMAEFKSFALRGIGSSVGLANFPLSVWLYSMPLLIWKHPYSATLFLAALNTAAVYVCYRLTRKYWGQTAALVAALMFAVSPWAVIYSRKIWAQNLLPLLVLFYIGTALAAFVENRRWFLLLHLVALAVVAQIHLSGLAFVPLTAIFLLIFHRRVRWIEVALGLLAAALLAAPFGIYLLQQSASSGLRPPASNLLTRSAAIDLGSLRFAWMVLTGADIHSLAGPRAFQDYLNSVPNIDPFRWLWGALAAAGLGLAVYRRKEQDFILAAWFIAPILFFVAHNVPIFPHYFIITLPAGYILSGDTVSALLEFLNREGAKGAKFFSFVSSRSLRLGGSIIVAASGAAQAGVWLALLFFIGAVNTPGGFGTPLGLLLNVVDQAKAMKAEQAAPEILLVGEGDDPSVDEFPAVMDVLFHDTPHRFVDGDEAVVLPQGGAVVVIQSGDFKARGWYENCAAVEACLPLRQSEQGIELAAIPPDTQIEIAHPFPEPRTLANGVELLGWDTESGWTVIWRPGYIPPAADYHFFNHAPGAQADGVGYPSNYWRDGDLVISFFDLRPITFPIRVGMYEYPSVVNVSVMDAAGTPYSDAVTVER